MEPSDNLKISAAAGITAAVLAVAAGRAHRWVRVALVFATIMLAGIGGLFAYRSLNAPKTLTIAIGSADGDLSHVTTAIAARMAQSGAPVRLKIVDKGTLPGAAQAFAQGETDLAIVRGDMPNLSTARTLVLISHGVVLLVVPPGSTIESIPDLKGKTVGVVGGPLNRQIVDILTREYDLARIKVQFKDLMPAEVAPAVAGKQVQALLVVMPISDKYLALLRSIFPGNAKQRLSLVSIDSAGAIAAIARAYESYDLPKGTVRGSPPIPDDDLTTLRVPFYLVAGRKVSDDLAGAVVKALMDARRDLLGDFPQLAQISSPSTEKDAYIPIHPGAAAYFDGEQKTIFDKYGDQLFYGSMLIGSLTSLIAAAWTFMMKGPENPAERPLNRLYALAERIRKTRDESELAEIEQTIDDILKGELERYSGGEAEAAEAAALSLATHRLEYLIGQARAGLTGTPRGAPATSTAGATNLSHA
jgi:TRAP transporter TAXI family solute receptor